MAQVNAQLSTGQAGLDRMLKGLIPGDNIVWQVRSVEEYAPFVAPHCDFASRRGKGVSATPAGLRSSVLRFRFFSVLAAGGEFR